MDDMRVFDFVGDEFGGEGGDVAGCGNDGVAAYREGLDELVL
jgi:hypothetical protein